VNHRRQAASDSKFKVDAPAPAELAIAGSIRIAALEREAASIRGGCLQAYFRSIRTSAEPTFTHWWEAVPTR